MLGPMLIQRGVSAGAGVLRSLMDNATSDEASAAASGTAPKDEVSLSDPKRILEGAMANLFGVRPGADGSISVEDIQRSFEQRFERLSGSLTQLLRDNGVDRSQDAVLQCDPTGKVVCANGHPDAEKIEQLFADRPELANEFRYLSATGSFLQAAERHVDFAKAYADNPQAAIAQFESMLDDGANWRFQMRIGEDEIVRSVRPVAGK